MEDFGSQPRDPTSVCYDEIEKCDALIGVYAHRYGHRPTGAESITELEYDFAVSSGKDLFCYLVDPEFLWPKNFKDTGEDLDRLRSFTERVSAALTTSLFQSPDNLAWKVISNLSRWMILTTAPAKLPALRQQTLKEFQAEAKHLIQLKDLHHMLHEVTRNLQSLLLLVRSFGTTDEYLHTLLPVQVLFDTLIVGTFNRLFHLATPDARHRRFILGIRRLHGRLDNTLRDTLATVKGVSEAIDDCLQTCTVMLLSVDMQIRDAASRTHELSERFAMFESHGG